MIRGLPEPDRFARRLAELDAAKVMPRVWVGDHTVWGPRPDEIANRLGWLRAPEVMSPHLASLRRFAETVRGEGCETVALFGMGGSSLAPETLAKLCPRDAGPELVVLDTTHPTSVRRALDRLDPRRTLYLVSTKSGTTPETLALFRIFYCHAAEALGRDRAGARFAAITDPGSPLISVAREHGFRQVFLNDPTFGGRYSALSLVGLVPAAVLGLDLDALLDSARGMSARCGAAVPVGENPAAVLAVLLAAHVDEGRDKVTFVLPPAAASFGDWVEQLIAESTGKSGTGVVPIVGESLGPPSSYGSDRVFVRFEPSAPTPQPAILAEPITPETLGGQFLLWELATALVGHFLGVNPFDQPDVEAAKRATRDILSAYRDRGESPAAALEPLSSATLDEIADLARPGDYVALLAYLDADPGAVAALSTLRRRLRDATACATALGFGPRFLHSTGQLHKGDSGRGVFVELVDRPADDVEIPDGDARPLGLRLLIRAQALGDARALAERGRRIRTFDLGADAPGALRRAAAG